MEQDNNIRPKKRTHLSINFNEKEEPHFGNQKKDKALVINPHTITENDRQLYEESYNEAPEIIQEVVDLIAEQDELATYFKNILLTGPSGSGKSTLAKAIAYKLGREFLFIRAPSLLGKYRNQTSENLEKLFEKLNIHENKPILVLDEINALTDTHNSEHADTADTSKQLWTLLDEAENQKEFLLIGTTNVTNKMPHQLQSRFEGNTFEIANPSLEACKKMIIFCLNKFKTIEIDRQIYQESYLNELATKIHQNNFSRRRIAKLIPRALLLQLIDNRQHKIKQKRKKLTSVYLDRAFNELTQEITKYWDYTNHMTDEERRHQENKEIQIKLAELNAGIQTMFTFYNLLYKNQKDFFGKYEKNALINHARQYFYNFFPSRKPVDYESLPEEYTHASIPSYDVMLEQYAAEDAKQKGISIEEARETLLRESDEHHERKKENSKKESHECCVM